MRKAPSSADLAKRWAAFLANHRGAIAAMDFFTMPAGSCRAGLLDYGIVFNERHLKRLMAEYVRHYHNDRTHLGIHKQTPAGRKAAKNPTVNAKAVSTPRRGGLPHRYDLAS
jgi:hypothetical protein